MFLHVTFFCLFMRRISTQANLMERRTTRVKYGSRNSVSAVSGLGDGERLLYRSRALSLFIPTTVLQMLLLYRVLFGLFCLSISTHSDE